jgi:hypothetical protein
VVDACADALGFAGSSPVFGSVFAAVHVCPAVRSEELVPGGVVVVAGGGGVGVGEEDVGVVGAVVVNYRFGGEALDEPFGCFGEWVFLDAVAVFEGVWLAVGVDGGWGEDLAAVAADV